MHIKIIIPIVLLLLLGPGASHAAFAGTVEMQSIHIAPVETTAGKHPDITGTLKAVKAKTPAETIEINVVATLTRPDHTVKSWMWKKILIKSGEIRTFPVPKEYDVKSGGVYKVDFSVYSKDMLPLNRLSKSFTVIDSSHPPVKTSSQESTTGKAGNISGKTPQPQSDERNVGIGVYANLVNSAGGATLLLWPSKYIGFQGSYSVGQFTTAEGRLLARIPRSSGINPYVGVGFSSVTTERTVDVIKVKTTFTGSGVSGALGIEVPLSKSVVGYVEIAGSSISLKKELTSGGQTGTAEVKYSPVTIGFSLVYFVF